MPERKRPSVAFITGEYPPQIGGVGDHVAMLRETLEQFGVTTWVITDSKNRPESDHPRTARVMRRWGFTTMTALLRHIQGIDPDIVHIHYQSGAFGLNPAINLLPRFLRMGRMRARTVTTLHDLRTPYILPKVGPLRRFLVKRLAKDSDGVIFVSPEDAVDLFGVELEVGEAKDVESVRASLVPVGPTVLPVGDGGDRRSLRLERGLPAKAFVVGHVGFRQKNKGMRVLADALQQTQHLGDNVVLALIGAGEPSGDSRRRDRREGVDDIGQWRVVESGPLEPDEISRWLHCCDICVLPFAEGLSLRRSTFMNAIAHGLPVVTTRPVRKLPDVVSGENVILVPPGDPTSLSYAVAQFAKSEKMRREYGERAKKLSEKFSWTANARTTLDLYHAVTDAD
jgi:glycosyltransferase involved in cell wall biosynthesis